MAYRLATLRLQAGWSQQDLAAEIGKTPQQLSRWENGEGDIKLGTAIRIADALGTSLDALAGRDGGQDKPTRKPGEDELVSIYEALPEDGRAAVLTLARQLRGNA